MRGLIASVLLFASMVGVTYAQGMDTTPPAEMKAADFLKGNYKGQVTFHFGPQTMTGSCTAKSERWLNDRYLRTMIGYTMKTPGAPDTKVEGMHMLSYDPQTKQYVGYWFDGTVSFAMHMTGNFDGDKLVMISDPTPMESGGPTGIMRSSWWKTNDGISFSLELKQGDNWMPMMEGTFKKA